MVLEQTSAPDAARECPSFPGSLGVAVVASEAGGCPLNNVHREVRIGGRDGFQQGVGPLVAGLVLADLAPLLEGSARMAFEGRSSGRRRSWLARAGDVRLADIDRGDEAVLHFVATPFGELAEELYRQEELWSTRPDPAWTAFDTAGAVVRDIAVTGSNGEWFDAGLLRQVQRFGRVLNDEIMNVRIQAQRHSSELPLDYATVDRAVVLKAGELGHTIPAPREVRVVGVLDMLRRSTQAFALRLDGGDELRGVLVDADMADVRALLGCRVVVQGKAVFRPSGRVLRVDARAINEGTNEPTFWSKMPHANPAVGELKAYRQPQSSISGVNAFFGKWPGDESDEELLRGLEELG